MIDPPAGEGRPYPSPRADRAISVTIVALGIAVIALVSTVMLALNRGWIT